MCTNLGKSRSKNKTRAARKGGQELLENNEKIDASNSPPSTKLTYSAQHAPNLAPSLNAANAGSPYCYTTPLYNVSSGVTHNGPNLPRENAMPYNYAPSCPCTNLPPPLPPCTPRDDLWDLQFSRWWGWNWIRKREEIMNNQKKAELKGHRSKSKDFNDEKKPKGKDKVKRGTKQDDFFTWCNKIFRGGRRKQKPLKPNEKKQLQELYDTPCSSVTFNDYCPCPADDWECRSLNLEGQYECYSTRHTSTSTMVMQNKTRRQTCKHNLRKHQSWVCEKTDSSSSDECCPCVSVCPQKGQSSTQESVEYLTMRMAHIKSDCDEDAWKCNCPRVTKRQKNYLKPCCPCMVKLVCDKQQLCKPQPKCKQKLVDKCECTRPRKYIPIPSKSLPICRTENQVKVPRFRRRNPQPCQQQQLRCTPVIPKIIENRKRKHTTFPECCCQKKEEYIIYYPCLCEPVKKTRKLQKSKKAGHCCPCRCCCCCCCGCRNKTDANQTDTTTGHSQSNKSKSLVQLKLDKDGGRPCYCSKSMRDNLGGKKAGGNDKSFRKPNLNVAYPSNASNNGIRVSEALENGSYVSPLTGKSYPIRTQVFPPKTVVNRFEFATPIDICEKIKFAPSPTADDEHKALLTAVCEAIMSARRSTDKNNMVKPFPPTSNYRFKYNYQTPSPIDNLVKENVYCNDFLGDYTNDIENIDALNYNKKGPKYNFAKQTRIPSKDLKLPWSSSAYDPKVPLAVSQDVISPNIGGGENHANNFPPFCDQPRKTRIPIRKFQQKTLLNSTHVINEVSPSLMLANTKQKTNHSYEDSVDFNGLNVLTESKSSYFLRPDAEMPKSGVGFPTSFPIAPQQPNWLNSSKNGVFLGTGRKNKIDVGQLKKQQVYDLFSNDCSENCEHFPNLPYNFRPRPSFALSSSQTCPTVVLQELPLSDVTEETQTNEELSEREIRAMNLKYMTRPQRNSYSVEGSEVGTSAPSAIYTKSAATNTDLDESRASEFAAATGNELQEANVESFAEAEIACTDYSFQVPSRSSLSGVRNSLYYQHLPQHHNFFTHNVNSAKSKRLLSVVDNTSEDSVESEPKDGTYRTTPNSPDAGAYSRLHVTNVKSINCKFSPSTEENFDLRKSPQPYLSDCLETEPVFVTSSTSPFKTKYTKARAAERTVFNPDYIRRKFPKRDVMNQETKPGPSSNR